MYKLILLPLALDQGHGIRAMEIARRLRAKEGKIIAVHVIDQIPSFVTNFMSPVNESEIRKSAMKGIAERIGAENDAEAVVLVGHAGRTISDYAVEVGADCIIVGSHRPGLKDFFLGSTAARIVRYAQCSVHVLR
jgi:universal stress protein F